MSEIQYGVALSVLNGLVGIRYAALQIARIATPPNAPLIDELQQQFQEACDRRDNLGVVDPEGLQSLIDEYGPLIRKAVVGVQKPDSGCAA